MSLTSAIHESLPYIDDEPTPVERAAAQALIDAEAGPSPPTSHPSLPEFSLPEFSPLIESDLLRHSSELKQPLTGIDLSVYEGEEAPKSEDVVLWREALSRAYTAERYLNGRLNNLALLEQFGKNGWLVGNSQLEDILRGLEQELAARKTEIDVLAVQRTNAQEAVAGEVKGLEEGWKKGVGRVLETEVAAEGLRREILERRREGAS